MSYRIVIGVDFDEPGDIAMEEALRLASTMQDSELHPVYSIDGDPAVEVAAMDAMDNHLARGLSELRERVDRIARERGTHAHVRLHVRFGAPAKVLQQVAVDYDADVIVVGTHGRKGVERFLLGSVAAELVKDAHLPVVVARRKDFSGLTRSENIEPARPGEELHKERAVSDVIQVGRRPSHISGLV